MKILLDEFYDRYPDWIGTVASHPATLSYDVPDLAPEFNLSSVRERFPKLIGFIKSLETLVRKFDFADTGMNEWKNSYIFPDAFSKRKDRFNFDANELSAILNHSDVHIDAWVNDIFNRAEERRTSSGRMMRLLVTGEVGSGKSTTVKRVLKIHRRRFFENRLIPTRIEFRKLARSADPKDPLNQLETLRRATIDAMYRDICHYFINGTRLRTFMKNSLFSSRFENFVQSDYINTRSRYELSFTDIQREAQNFFLYNYNKSADFANMSRKQRNSSVYSTDYLFKEITIKFIDEVIGMEFLIIFDGFDYLTAADYIYHTENSEYIGHLAKFHDTPTGYYILRELNYSLDVHQITIMRDATFARFMERSQGLQEMHVKSHRRIAPPSSPDLVFSGIERVCKNVGVNVRREDVAEFVEYIRNEIRRSIVNRQFIQGDRLVSADVTGLRGITLFNGNARKELDFLRYVIELILREIISEMDSIDTRNFGPRELLAVSRTEDIKAKIRQKNYRLFSVFMCRKYHYFRNAIALGGVSEDLRPSQILELDGIGSYVDNIFNYDETERSLLSLVAKLRVCEIADGVPKTDRTISQLLGADYVTDLSRLLATMIRTGLLRARWKNASPYFQTEPLGQVCYKYLAIKPEYIEHVVLHTCLPFPAREACVRVLDRETVSARRWSTASIVNSFVLYQLVRRVEEEERARGHERMWLTSRMREAHKIAVLKEGASFGEEAAKFEQDIITNIMKMYSNTENGK